MLNLNSKNIIGYILFALIFFNTKPILAQMQFVQNKGQWDDKINYKSEFSTGAFFLENRGFTVLLDKVSDVIEMNEFYHNHVKKMPKSIPNQVRTLHSHAYNVTFLGGAFTPKNIPDKPLNTYNNYFIGNDENKWAGDCKIYTAITYKNVYPNIDVRYYSTQEKLKYDFIVHPGGNPAAIAMRYDGVDGLSIKNSELIIRTSVGEIKELAPYTYQANLETKKDVLTKYKIRDNVVTFDVGDYDPLATLIIDPQLIFSTLTGSAGDNWGYTATPGPDGSFFAGGISRGGSYPVSPGAFQTQYAGGGAEGDMAAHDIAIFKFSPNGSERLYATYLGGSGNEQPHSMIVDASGNLIVAGRSSSGNFPVRSPLFLSGSGNDIIITKFNATGTALIGSVKIGGNGEDGVNIRPKFSGTRGAESLRRNYGDDARSEVILDGSNNIYLASCTQSSNFPVTGGAAQTIRSTGQEGVILKLNPTLSGLLFSSYFGGSGNDACFVISINPVTNNVYVAGATESNNLPGNRVGAVGSNFNGDIDGFITIITPDGSSFVKTTYIGTSGKDLVYGLKFDKLGFPYINGTTTSNSWPITPAGIYGVPSSKQFISKLQSDLSANVYSTVFGTVGSSDPNISPTAFLVDRCENVYVSGWGGGINTSQNYSSGNTSGLPNVNPLNVNPPDGNDFYFFVLKKDATSQLFGSNFGQVGGTVGDHADGGTSRFDANGVIYQAICANCSDRGVVTFPTTAGVWARLNGGVNTCNQAAVKVEMNFSGIGAEVQSEIGGEINDTLGCISLKVNFKDLKAKGVTYYWDFGDPFSGALNTATTIIPEAFHEFENVGVFRVRLIAEDPSTCNQRDTSYITIRTGRDRVLPDFDIKKLGDCKSKTFQYINKTTSASLPPIGFLPQTFVWNFGDGSPVDTASFADIVTHPYASVGTYKVILTVIDTRFCNSPQSDTFTLRINDNVKAKPTTNELGCAPYSPIFKNLSDAGISWKWELLDAVTNIIIGTSTDEIPTFPPLPIGQYKYRLIASDSTTCNKIDTSNYFTITVVQKPIALFSWAPIPPEPNVPVRFTNLSSFADTYLWEFGDGETATAFAPVHEYNATGIYTAVLTSISRAGCAATDTMQVSVIVNPLLDVPNAFTPGRFGINSIVNVRGFGIGKMDWRIYNRWGQMIFKSDNKRQGWDGTYRGKLQPLDNYSYTLNVEFTDGQKLRKTGDITLLR